jgi:hypothetical protein
MILKIGILVASCELHITIASTLYIFLSQTFTDSQWVQALTVPMHLGLIHMPFVPHNLLSAQDSPGQPCSFTKVPDVPQPRLNILMSSGSEKETQIYYPLLSKKSPGKQNSSRFPNVTNITQVLVNTATKTQIPQTAGHLMTS